MAADAPLGPDTPRMIENSSRRLTRVMRITLRVANFQMALSLDPKKNKCFCVPIMPKVVVGATTHADVKELGLEHQCGFKFPLLIFHAADIHYIWPPSVHSFFGNLPFCDEDYDGSPRVSGLPWLCTNI
eukprot:SAG11_NODE_497_length_8941_cov_5.441303_4_plen_129_part_00